MAKKKAPTKKVSAPKTSMDIIDVDISTVYPYPNNPRINDNAVDALVRSIAEFGWQQPIVVDKDRVIIAGHTRLKAAKVLGLQVVPIKIASNLTEDQVRAFRIADNKTSENAEWDESKLLEEIMELSANDYDLDILAFEADALSELLDGDNDCEIEGMTDPDDIPEGPELDDNTSKLNSIYQLGKNRVACGDATDVELIRKLCEGNEIDLLLTDPPYGVDYDGESKGGNKDKIKNDVFDDIEGFRMFLRKAYYSANQVMRDGAVFYIWHAHNYGYAFQGACYDVSWKIRECLVWIKHRMIFGRQDYHWEHEACLEGAKPYADEESIRDHDVCLYGWKKGTHKWLSDRSQTTILDFQKPTKNKEHPTMKPVSLFAYQIQNNTRKGQHILDLFGGSGTTIIACERTQRVGYAIELDPKFCDVIRKRWAEYVHGEGCDWQDLTPEV